MGQPLTRLTRPKILIGEGQDEEVFFGALLEHLRIDDVQVAQCAGKDAMAKFLKVLPKLDGFGDVVSIGVTRDADDDASQAFRSVCTSLSAANLPVPSAPGVAVGEALRASVLILPGAGRTGMLEDLCLAAVAAQPGFACIDEYLACVQGRAGRLHDARGLPKARARVWLASHDPPDLAVGLAARKGFWPWTAPEFGELKRFVQAL